MKTILALFFVIGMVSCVPVPSSEENFITGILSGVSTLVTTILEGTIGKRGIVNNVGKGVGDYWERARHCCPHFGGVSFVKSYGVKLVPMAAASNNNGHLIR